jgi:hypothetical protein
MGSEVLKDVKEIAVMLLDLSAAVVKAGADGKYSWDDLGLLFPLIGDFGPAMGDANLALSQWKAASSEDRQALVAELDAQFSLGDKVIEEKIEAGLAMLIHAGKLLS